MPTTYYHMDLRAPGAQQVWEQWVHAGAPGVAPPGFVQGSYKDGTPYYYYGGVSSPAAAAVSVATGVNPVETSYSLFGHTIPLSLGRVRIGGDIIAGPWVSDGLATFCISLGVPADPYDTRTLKEIAFDSEVVWENGAFNTEAFTFRYYPGTLTQAADPLEISHFGADAVAYRPQMLLWFENLPIASTKFQKIPYVAAVIEDSSHGDVNLGWAFEQLAYSPWVGYSTDEFETIGITDGVTNGGMIFAQDAEFLSTIQQFGRFYRNWNILQTDMLRIVDRGAATAPDITFNTTRLMNSLVFQRAESNAIPRVLELSTIDPDADYTIVPSTAVRPRAPVNVSASVQTETAYLPIVMDSATRMSLVTYTKYQEEIARKRITGTAMMYGFQIEPGDLVAVTGLGEDLPGDTYKVVETSHGANYTVEFTGEAFLKCDIPQGDPYFIYVVLLMGFEGVDGSQGAPGFTDESQKHKGIAAGGATANDPSIDTGERKFGASSLQIPGYGGGTSSITGISFASDNDFRLAASNSDQYTIEVWTKITSNPIGGALVGDMSGRRWGLLVENDMSAHFMSSSDASLPWEADVRSAAGAVALNAWHHVAVDKDSAGKIRLYVDGVMMASATPADSSINPAGGLLVIGGIPGNNGLVGFLDELRITKGIARYQSDGGFAVPVTSYPRSEDIP